MKIATGLVLCLAACSSPNTHGAATQDAGPDAGPAPADAAMGCAPRSGLFQITDAVVSGNCGPASAKTSFAIADSTQGFAVAYVLGERAGAGKTVSVTTFIKACTGTVAASVDNCRIDFDFQCPNSGAAGHFQKTGRIQWAADGNAAQETQDYSEFRDDGTVVCTGRYAPAVTR